MHPKHFAMPSMHVRNANVVHIEAEVVTGGRRSGDVRVRGNGITVGFKAIGTRLVFHVPVLGRVAALAPLIENAMPNVIAAQVQYARRDATRETTPLSDDRRARGAKS